MQVSFKTGLTVLWLCFAACLGNADIIQPGLIQLQPNFDDFLMDTLEPLPSLQGKLGTSECVILLLFIY